MPRGIKKTYLITVFVQDLEQYIPRVAMEKACFSVFELHVQVTITYQGIIRLIFSTFVWFAFLPFSRLCASFLCVCVCVEGGNTQQRRGRGEVAARANSAVLAAGGLGGGTLRHPSGQRAAVGGRHFLGELE